MRSLQWSPPAENRDLHRIAEEQANDAGFEDTHTNLTCASCKVYIEKIPEDFPVPDILPGNMWSGMSAVATMNHSQLWLILL